MRIKNVAPKKLNINYTPLVVLPRQISAYLHYLREEDFLKESRYAELFVRGKVNNNKWGPRKIEVALKSKKVDPTLIRHELEKFDAEWPELKAYWSARMTKGLGP